MSSHHSAPMVLATKHDFAYRERPQTAVVRLLAEDRALREVRIALSRGNAELGGLEALLCTTYCFEDALVASLSSREADATVPIGAALGEYLSSLLRNDMKIGLG